MNDIDIKLTFPEYDALLAGTVLQLGYPDKDEVSEKVMRRLDQGMARCRELSEPAVLCRRAPFKAVTSKTIKGEKLSLDSLNWTRLTRRMTGVYELCCAAVTVGEAVDRKIGELNQHAMLEALVLDAGASVLAEFYADQIQQQVAGHYQQQGLQASARFSPGYCDWPMKSGQKALFKFLGPESIGIQATGSGLMTPRKSVTAVIIAAEQMPAESPCFLCARECPHRRAPYSPDIRQ